MQWGVSYMIWIPASKWDSREYVANCCIDDGYLLQNEWPIYIFDALPMAIVLVICVKWHENNLTPRKDAIDLEHIEQQLNNERY